MTRVLLVGLGVLDLKDRLRRELAQLQTILKLEEFKMVTIELVLRGRVLQLAPELRALETDSSGVRVGLQLRVTSLHHFLLHLRIALDLCVLID